MIQILIGLTILFIIPYFLGIVFNKLIHDYDDSIVNVITNGYVVVAIFCTIILVLFLAYVVGNFIIMHLGLAG